MYKKVNKEFESSLFRDFRLTSLMVLKKNGRKIRSNEDQAIYTLLDSKLNEYGIQLFGQFDRGGMTLRGIVLHDEFPIENEPIIAQLYGYDGLITHVQLKGFDSFSTAFDYNVDTKECELQRHSWGTVTHRIKYDSFASMMKELNEKDHENIFT